jgi:hypothetical protein
VLDILGDGINEIVVGSVLGNVHVFRHTNPGDLTSLFATTPFMTINVGGGVLELAKEFKGFVAVPEPSSGVLIVVGVVGVVAAWSRRRRGWQGA